MLTFDDLQKGDLATIIEVQGDDAVAVRLMEMGMIDGDTIEVLGFAPMGDPIECCLHGYRLSLRRSEARQVIVQRK